MFWQLFVVLALMIPILAIVLDSQVGKALAARLERRNLHGSHVTHERIKNLETEIDRLSMEVCRLEEESQFLHKLLTDGPDASQAKGANSDPHPGAGD